MELTELNQSYGSVNRFLPYEPNRTKTNILNRNVFFYPFVNLIVFFYPFFYPKCKIFFYLLFFKNIIFFINIIITQTQ